MRPASALTAPKHLGKYEVGAKIGGGGMASVYVGRTLREDGSEERVALKVIRDELAHDDQFKSMFIDEAKILAKLSHPNVIHTMEYGVTGDHRFIAMELLSGRTYSDVWDVLEARGASMLVPLAAWICARVADGLHSAHELVDEAGTPLGVIHRDVNPSNIFLTHDGDVKLIDFGLAKARVRLSKSADGIVKGKIPYLAPEQAHGRPIDRRIDVYALGATLWESVTMKRLFKRATDVDTLRAIREAKVPDVRTLVKGFPEPVWRVIETSLREDPEDRYETAEAFGAALDAYVGARQPGMRDELASLLTSLFPGQEARQATWERAATSVRLPAHTMPPPAPVPVASSSLLEEGGRKATESIPPSLAHSLPPPSSLVRSKKRKNGKTKARRDRKSPATPTAREISRTATRRPNPPRNEHDANLRGASASNGNAMADRKLPRSLLVSLLVAIAVLTALALALSAR